MKKIIKTVGGITLIILGAIGTLIPIPLVPFFLLIILGLEMLGFTLVSDKLKEWSVARQNRKKEKRAQKKR